MVGGADAVQGMRRVAARHGGRLRRGAGKAAGKRRAGGGCVQAGGGGVRKIGERERKLWCGWDPTAAVVCTNLKHWKMWKKKTFRRCIGSTEVDHGCIVCKLIGLESWPGPRTFRWAGPHQQHLSICVYKVGYKTSRI